MRIDCNDFEWATHPVNDEACNGFDDDCDGTVDEGCTSTCSNPEPIPVARSLPPLPGGSQYSPRIARGVRSTAVTRVSWDRENCYQIAVTILNDDLTERMPSIRLKALAGRSTAARYSVIAWVEDRYLVAWQEGQADANCELLVPGSQSYVAAIAPNGQVIVPPTPFTCLESPSTSSGPVSIAALGDTAAIAFTQGNGTVSFDGTWLTRVDKDSVVLDGCGIRVSDQVNDEMSVASNGSELGVAMTLMIPGVPFPTSEIFFQRYTASLQPIDTELRRMTFDTTRSADPQVVWGPGESPITRTPA